MKNYTIYQLPVNNDRIFRSYHEESFELNDYCAVWCGEYDSDDMSDIELCEALFQEFNIARPENFAGHSMSVSDVIEIETNGVARLYYCNMVGFTEITIYSGNKTTAKVTISNLTEFDQQVGFQPGAKSRWENYTQEERDFLDNWFEEYYAAEALNSVCSINDFIWLRADDILETYYYNKEANHVC